MWVDRISGYRAFLQYGLQLDLLKESTSLRVVDCQLLNTQLPALRPSMNPSSTGRPHMDTTSRAESNVILDSILTYYTNMTETRIRDDGSHTPTIPLQTPNRDQDKHASNIMTNPIAIKDIGEFPLPPHACHLGPNKLSPMCPSPNLKCSTGTIQSSLETFSIPPVSSGSVIPCSQAKSTKIDQSNKFRPLQLIGSPRVDIAVNKRKTPHHIVSTRDSPESNEPRSETIDNTDFWHDWQRDSIDDSTEQLEATRNAGLREPDWRAQVKRSQPIDQLAGTELLPAINFGDHPPLTFQTKSSNDESPWPTSEPTTWELQLPAKYRGSLQSEDSFWNVEFSPASRQRLLGHYSTQSISQDEDTSHCLAQIDEALRDADWSGSMLRSSNTSDEQDSKHQLDYDGEFESPNFSSCLSAIYDLESSLRTSSNSAISYHNPLSSSAASSASEIRDAQEEVSWPSRGSSLDASLPPKTHPTASNTIEMDVSKHRRRQRVPHPFYFTEPKEKFEIGSSIEEQYRIGLNTGDIAKNASINRQKPDLHEPSLEPRNDAANESIRTRKRSATQYDTKLTWPFPSGRMGRIDVRQRSNTQPNRSEHTVEGFEEPVVCKEKSLPALPDHINSQGRQQTSEKLATNPQLLEDEYYVSGTTEPIAASIPRPVLTRKPVYNPELHKSLPSLPEILDTSAIAASPLSKEVPLPEFMTSPAMMGQTNKAMTSLNSVLVANYPPPPPMAHFRNSRVISHSMEESATTSEDERSFPDVTDIKLSKPEIHDAYVTRPHDLEQDNVEPAPLLRTVSWESEHGQSARDEPTEIQQHLQKQKRSRRGCSSGFLHFWQTFSCSASPTHVARTRSPAETAQD